jgi:hypothetical protein
LDLLEFYGKQKVMVDILSNQQAVFVLALIQKLTNPSLPELSKHLGKPIDEVRTITQQLCHCDLISDSHHGPHEYPPISVRPLGRKLLKQLGLPAKQKVLVFSWLRNRISLLPPLVKLIFTGFPIIVLFYLSTIALPARLGDRFVADHIILAVIIAAIFIAFTTALSTIATKYGLGISRSTGPLRIYAKGGLAVVIGAFLMLYLFSDNNTQQISIVIRDERTGRPVSGRVEVDALGAAGVTEADNNGLAIVKLPSSFKGHSIGVTVTKDGYAPQHQIVYLNNHLANINFPVAITPNEEPRPAHASSQMSRVQILDSRGHPVSGAIVIIGRYRSGLTDKNGRFVFSTEDLSGEDPSDDKVAEIGVDADGYDPIHRNVILSKSKEPITIRLGVHVSRMGSLQ